MNQEENDRGQKHTSASVAIVPAPSKSGSKFGNSIGDGLDQQQNHSTKIVNISDSVKQEVNEAQELDDVEIFDSSDEEDSGESSGMQINKIKNESGNGNDNDNEIESNSSMKDDNGEGRSDEVFVKNEIDDDWLGPKQEAIDEYIPIRTFDPTGDTTNDNNIQVNGPRSSLGSKNSMKTADVVCVKEKFDIEPKQEIIDEDIPIRTFNPNDVTSNGGYNTISDTPNGNHARSYLGLKARTSNESDAQKPSCSKNAKRFTCELCGYGTDRKEDLNKHMQTHTKEKPYRCSRCAKCFARSSHLKVHMVTHKNEFPFHCSGCFRGFFQYDEKEAHERNCRSRHYECFICKYVTIHKTSLVIHMRTHSGNKPYRCNRCSKGFTQLQHLKIHMTTHKDRKLPFHCKGCLRRFPRKCEMEDHERGCRNRRYECYLCKKYVTCEFTRVKNHFAAKCA